MERVWVLILTVCELLKELTLIGEVPVIVGLETIGMLIDVVDIAEPCVNVKVATPVVVLDVAAIDGAGTPILKLLPEVVLIVATPAAVMVTLEAGKVTVLPLEIEREFPEIAKEGVELMV